MRPKMPCQNCEKRYPCCHDHCEDYISAKEQLHAIKEKERADMYLDHEISRIASHTRRNRH